MTGISIGYARCSTQEQDVEVQRQSLHALGVASDRVYVDHGRTGRNRDRPALNEALAAVRAGDKFIVTKLDRLARSVIDARDLVDVLTQKGVSLQIGTALHDPDDPTGRLLFNILAMVAEFESDLIRARTREGMALARARGRLKGRQPQLSPKQDASIARQLDEGEFTANEIATAFNISRASVYRAAKRHEQRLNHKA